jgi:hypothetical protein
VRKLTPTILNDIVAMVWCNDIEKLEEGFVWNEEDFVKLFFLLKLKNFYRRLEKKDTKELLEELQKKYQDSCKMISFLIFVFFVSLNLFQQRNSLWLRRRRKWISSCCTMQ